MAADCCSSCEYQRTVGYPSTSWASCWRLVQCTIRQKQSKYSQTAKKYHWCTNRHMSAQSPPNTQSRTNAATLRNRHPWAELTVCAYMDVHASGSRSLPRAATRSPTYWWCLVYVCIAWNYDVYLLIWCGVTKYYLVLLKCLQLGNFLYSAHAPKLEATNINCLRSIMPRV